MERMRTQENFSRHHARRNSHPILNHDGPLRTLPEVAAIMNLTTNQVQHLERRAFDKIRAALSAYGYNKELP